MPDIEQRIRATRPRPETLPGLDLDRLRRRAERRTRAARLGTGLAVLVLVGAVLAVGALVPALRARDVRLVPAGPAAVTEPAPEVPEVPEAPEAPGTALSPEPVAPTEATPEGEAGSGEILASPIPGRAVEAPAAAPVAPACGAGASSDGLATVTLGPDVPAPRCMQLLPAQRIRVVNGNAAPGDPTAGGERVSATLGGYAFELDPGEQVVLPLPVSSYLQPGVHRIDSEHGPARAELWVLQAPSASLGQQGVIDAFLAFARDPSDRTFRDVPLGPTVALGDGSGQLTSRTAAELRDPAVWPVAAGGWQSALGLLGSAPEEPVFTVGERPHCQGPMPPPPQLEALTRLSIQAPPWRGCHGWFAVDLLVDDDGTGAIRAVVVQVGPQ